MLASPFRIRWILWAIGAVILLFSLRRPFHRLRLKISPLAVVLAFFALSLTAKLSQFYALTLNAQDFWLFEDMLQQMIQGAPFLTRFAPQAQGWVQHGAVHAFFGWYLAVPLAWLFGSTGACLIFEPLVFALAGYVLVGLAKPRWGALPSVLIGTAFLVSSQVGKILTYDVHPEAAYPILVLTWAWAARVHLKSDEAGRDFRPVHWITLLLSTLAALSLKEDAFLVFFPLIGYFIWHASGIRRAALFTSLAVALLGAAFQFHATHQWANGGWGPTIWQGVTVTVPHSPPVFHGLEWDSPSSALKIAGAMINSNGGWVSSAGNCIRFLLSKPWVSLILMAPWLVITPLLWILLLPIACALALLGGMPAGLINYYAAPLLGSFWLAVALTPPKQEQRRNVALLWTLLASLLLGSGGIEIFYPSKLSQSFRAHTNLLSHCLEKTHGKGLIPAPLLSLLPHDRFLSSFYPKSSEDLRKLDFVILTPHLGSYGLSEEETDRLIKNLDSNIEWSRLGQECQSGDALFWIRKKSAFPELPVSH